MGGGVAVVRRTASRDVVAVASPYHRVALTAFPGSFRENTFDNHQCDGESKKDRGCDQGGEPYFADQPALNRAGWSGWAARGRAVVGSADPGRTPNLCQDGLLAPFFGRKHRHGVRGDPGAKRSESPSQGTPGRLPVGRAGIETPWRGYGCPACQNAAGKDDIRLPFGHYLKRGGNVDDERGGGLVTRVPFHDAFVY